MWLEWVDGRIRFIRYLVADAELAITPAANEGSA